MSKLTKDVLLAALRQLNTKWAGQGGVTRVVFQVAEGKPVFYFQGPSASPPPGLPGRMTVPMSDGKTFAPIAILWRQEVPAVGIDKGYLAPGPTKALTPPPNRPVRSAYPELFNPSDKATVPLDPFNEKDVDKAYWFFFSQLDPRPIETVQPAFHVPLVGTGMEMPEPEAERAQLSVDARLPQYDIPNWWAKPFEPHSCLCCSFYETPILILSYRVPETYLLVLDGWSFTVDQLMAVGEIFEVSFRRDGDELLRYEEVVIDPLNPDPAQRTLFSSSAQIQDIPMRFDRNQMLNVYVTLKGTFPFLKTPTDTFCGTLCILLHGWLGSLIDNRDGTPRPVDPASLRDGSGDEDLIQVDTQKVKELNDWLEAVVGFVKEE